MGGKLHSKAAQKKAAAPRPCWAFRVWCTVIFITFADVALWVGHSLYLHNLFENVRFFSHLADFEREMAYRTEMGFYFSYYKTIVLAPSFADGLHQIRNDNVTEFGHTINALHRFNLYPEVLLAGAFRIFKRISDYVGYQSEICWHVNRGAGLSPVKSCEGLGNVHYFYIYHVFGIAGSVLSSIFLLGVLLSNSFWGGIISAAAFLFNHGEATRVQWTPPLRESFAYPIFIAQIAVLTFILRNRSQRHWPFILLSTLTTFFILFWQFSQFVLATQLGALFAVFLFDFITPQLLFSLWKSFVVSFFISLAFLFGNLMLLNSLFSNSLIAILMILILEKLSRNYLKFRPIFVFFHLLLYLAFVFGGKLAISQVFDIRDDNHVVDILRSKFSSDFDTFHTRLYTCAAEFDFIGFEAIMKLTQSFLLPTATISFIMFVIYLWRFEIFKIDFWWRNPDVLISNSGQSIPKPFPEVIYNTIQLICFTIISTLIMRLKMFSTPHFCIIASLIANKSLLTWAIGPRIGKWRLAFVFVVLAAMTFEGRKNVLEQLSMRGEYNNPEQEQLFSWIMDNTKSKSVFAGSMPVMANVKLSTLRPIVNHPQYENEEIRNRTLKVYSMYSRKPIDEVHNELKKLGVDYFIFQQSSCSDYNPKPKCTYLSMWDLEDPINRGKEPSCNYILRAFSGEANALKIISPFFEIVYGSDTYIVLTIKKS